MIRQIIRLFACALLLVSVNSQAATITVFNSFIDGGQANMGNGTGSPGVGSATMTLDHDTSLFSWFIAWQDLTAPVIAAHFHGPAAPGTNAGVEVGFDHTLNPTSGSATLSADQIDDLLLGLWYINIHTEAFTGGEIRGQVLPLRQIPLPAAVWLFGLALVTLTGLRQKR